MAAAATDQIIDLFAGPGGWDLAARALDLDPLGIEWDDAACATREAAGLRTLQADVADLDPRATLINHFADQGAGPTALWGLIASPPCQAFSMAGQGAGRRALDTYRDAIARWAEGKPPSRDELDEACEDERAHLILEPLRWTLALRPRWVACEQVEPVLPLWEAVAGALTEAGYSTWTGVLSAEQYGVAQTRKRAFLLASLDGPVKPPPATHQRYIAPRRKEAQEDSLFDAGDAERIVVPEDRDLSPWVSMAEALGWQGAVRTNNFTAIARDPDGRRTKSGSVPYERQADAPAPTVDTSAGNWKLRANAQANATERCLDEPAPTITGGHDHGERRWVHDRPAPTIVTTRRSDEGIVVGRQLPEGEGRNVGGHGWTSERPATTVAGDTRVHPPGHKVNGEDLAAGRDGYEERRGANAVRVSLAEALVLQSFPPDYPVQGTKTKQFEQVGNAVPPLLALAVLRAVVPAELAEAA